MTEGRSDRRLAAILAADVSGYSRLMGRDEEGTLTRLKAHRVERLQPIVSRYRGRVFKFMGDGALVEFASAVDALSAAIAFQQSMAESNLDVSGEQRVVFRVGLHLGDVIVDGDDLYGDGINIAARLEGEAAPGGIVVSRSLHDATAGRLPATFDALGDLELKNIEKSVGAFAVRWQASNWTNDSSPTPPIEDAPPLPDKPSIAVLPFQNMSGDPEQEYFVDGLVEEIITALSRNKALFVIARNSSFSYKGTSPDIRRVGRELGVRYVLEGSIRRGGKRLRIIAQLIDAASGAHIWAERFDGTDEDVFALQDEVAARVVAATTPALEQAEISWSQRKPTNDLQAYDLYLRAVQCFTRYSRDADEKAMQLLLRVIGRDAGFSLAYAKIAYYFVRRKVWAWDTDPVAESLEAERYARQALKLDPRNPDVLAHCGYSLLMVAGKMREGMALIDEALELDPNLAGAWSWGGYAHMFHGNRESIDYFQRALRLNPRDPRVFVTLNGLAHANCVAGHYDQTIHWAEKTLRELPTYPPGYWALIVGHVLAGHTEAAMQAWERYRSFEPDVRIVDIRKRMGTTVSAHLDRYSEALHAVGVPD